MALTTSSPNAANETLSSPELASLRRIQRGISAPRPFTLAIAYEYQKVAFGADVHDVALE